jgi:hypothetical protein
MTIQHHNDLTPQEWLDDEVDFTSNQDLTHPSPEFDALRQRATNRLNLEHEVLESLSELRRTIGLNQTEIAQRWGRGQSQVSKLERSPGNVELATLAGYVRALGGQLTMTIEVDGHFYHEDLVTSVTSSGEGKIVVTGKKIGATQVSEASGDERDRSRTKDGEVRKKRSNEGRVKSKKK